MQTRKLIAGETLLLEEEKGFCLVVDGLVEIFVKSNRHGEDEEENLGARSRTSYEDHDHPERGRQNYQLLTEVKNGAPMSSLFSVLSLFTENVRLRHGQATFPRPTSSSSNAGHPLTPTTPTDNPDFLIQHTPEPLILSDRSPRSSMSAADVPMPSVPLFSLDSGAIDTTFGQAEQEEPRAGDRNAKRKSVHPDIVARATVDTTIAIIPATAFHRLTRVYPKASAHIVQVILTRLQRVTLATANSYLGLTSEVLRTERHMYLYTSYDLPNHLRGSALDTLKAKFRHERERVDSPEESMKGIALHNPGAVKRRRSSGSLRKALAAHARLAAVQDEAVSPKTQDGSGGELRSSTISAGDLLTNIQISKLKPRVPYDLNMTPRSQNYGTASSFNDDLSSPLSKLEKIPFAPSPKRKSVNVHRQESLDEDDIFRQSILECVFKAIGLTGEGDTVKRPFGSVEQSPRLVSYDRQRQKTLFSSAFGLPDPYEGFNDGESDSANSTSGYGVPASLSTRDLIRELRDDMEIVFFPKNAILVEQGERNPGLYYVIEGFLDVSVLEDDMHQRKDTVQQDAYGESARESLPSSDRKRPRAMSKTQKPQSRKSLFSIKPGGLAGYVGTISSYRSFVDVRAKTDVYVGFLPRVSLEVMVEKYPIVLLTMAKRLTSLLPRVILHIDFALEWVQVNAGQVIHQQGDESDAIYIVLNGRLRAVLEGDAGNMQVVEEYGQGESVGELEVMTESRRPTTLHAIRDTELAKFPKTLFNSLALEHPGITMKISRLIAQRMRALIEDPILDQSKDRRKVASNRVATSSLNLRTTAILPVTAGVPVVEFGGRLLSALSQIGVANGVTSLNQAAILNHLGRHAFTRMGKLKLSQYLADLEERYGLLLYIADTSVNSPWTQTCITQADCILLVGLAEASSGIGEYERLLLGLKTTARKELVLLHLDRFSPPGLSRRWLQNRSWINGGHHHVQMAFRTDAEPINPQIKRFGTALKHRVQVLHAEIQKYTSRRIQQTPLYSADTPFKGDFHRLARRLCGKSVGLVLGGGGARGISQVGVIHALEEAGIPIDIIGGTSIGAFIGALYARDADVVPMYGRAKKFAGRMGSMWRFALDLTYPSASYTTGHEFNRGIFKTFGNSQIEDFWLDFYCNTTNISKSRAEFHSSGYVWRYVRASMSLAGLIPPLCDEGSMLLDGGYIDNLTVAHMKSLGAETIFAVDVGSLDDNQPQAFGDSLSGAWSLLNRWNPFSSYPNPPTLSEIQARLAYVSSVDALERAKATPGCLYMRPPIDAYGTLEFAKFDELYQIGYKYGQDYLGKLKESGRLPGTEETEEKRNLRRTMAPRRASI